MMGLMQDWPLLCHKFIDHAAACHSEQEVVTRSIEGPVHRTNYGSIRKRALQVGQRLDRDGIKFGDRIATLAWNTWRHLEVWYGIMGVGAICHTLNPRLFPEQIAWIVNHAQDRVLITDLTFVPLLEKLADSIPSVERFVILTDSAHMPATNLRGAIAYEEWIASVDGDFQWKSFNENTAATLCYTSGTTGDPKGVLYSHRANVLHALMVSQPDFLGQKSTDVVMLVVPLFHSNGWGLPFLAPMVGTKLVLPGARLDGESVFELLRDEGVTATTGVPTVWLQLLRYMEANTVRLPKLKRLSIGGSAPPPVLFESFERMGISVHQGWGMTEMGPFGSMGMLKPAFESLKGEERIARLTSQGVAPFLVEMKITDEHENELPRDGKAAGRLKVRGVSIVKQYYRRNDQLLDKDGYFDTGDIATIDEHAYMRITDRSKDIIKSGGEWISSVELENLAVGHEDVVDAAVIGVGHPKWGERPLLIVQLRPNSRVTKIDLLNFFEGKTAKWWIPEDVAVVDIIPHSATGKIKKIELREKFKNYLLETG